MRNALAADEAVIRNVRILNFSSIKVAALLELHGITSLNSHFYIEQAVVRSKKKNQQDLFWWISNKLSCVSDLSS